MAANRTMHLVVLGGAAEGDQLAARLRTYPSLSCDLIRPPNLRGTGFDQPARELLIQTREDLAALYRGKDAVIIAAHPFSGGFTQAAYEVATALKIPCLRLLRETWRPGAQDRWFTVDDASEAASIMRQRGFVQPFLTLGRDQLGPFIGPNSQNVFVRVLGEGPLPKIRRGKVLTEKGPFSVVSETELFRRLEVDCVVTRNIGGRGGWPKLQAARTLRIPVVLLRRPVTPDGLDVRNRAVDAVTWIGDRLGVEFAASAA